MRRTPLTLSLALGLSALLLAACGGGEGPTLTSGTSDPAPAPTASAAPSAEPASPAPAAEPTAAPDAGGASSSGLSEGAPEGGPLTVTEVRVARQDGYDRVVFELDGDAGGVPGWRVEYVDDPRRDGSGEPVDVDGEAVLVVLISGTGYPFDTGREEAASAAVPADVEVVTDVELGSVFEGTYEAFVGLSGELPFQVTRLADPARIVVDVEHG